MSDVSAESIPQPDEERYPVYRRSEEEGQSGPIFFYIRTNVDGSCLMIESHPDGDYRRYQIEIVGPEIDIQPWRLKELTRSIFNDVRIPAEEFETVVADAISMLNETKVLVPWQGPTEPMEED